ncbi:hypothetical protein WG66_009511 [Moniliophthora roreri]|nr:hypothetical protein WG66_009511 [Moniliophthora roreri]
MLWIHLAPRPVASLQQEVAIADVGMSGEALVDRDITAHMRRATIPERHLLKRASFPHGRQALRTPILRFQHNPLHSPNSFLDQQLPRRYSRGCSATKPMLIGYLNIHVGLSVTAR